MALVVSRFDVFLVALDPTQGHEIRKTRPCLIISPDEMNRHIGTVIVAPMTTRGRNYPSRIPVNFKRKKGANRSRSNPYRGQITPDQTPGAHRPDAYSLYCRRCSRLSRLLKNSTSPFSPREKVRMRGSKTKGYECDDSLTPALSRGERGRSGIFQQPVREALNGSEISSLWRRCSATSRRFSRKARGDALPRFAAIRSPVPRSGRAV